MELIVFLIIAMVGILIYYLIDTIKSLTEEIREIKTKCVENGNTIKQEFVVNTNNPINEINDNIIDKIKYFKTLFDN